MSALPILRQVNSPNYSSRDGIPISLIVIHDCEGGYEGSIAWFANRHSQVSAHLVLKADGSECTQMVPFAEKAWHACNAGNYRGIGLEIEGFEKNGFAQTEWRSAANIVAWLLHKYDLPCRWAERGVGSGFCSHFDLGAAGGGHCDPTTDAPTWARFAAQVRTAFDRGFLPEWGAHSLAPSAPAPVTPESIAAGWPVHSLRWIQAKIGVAVDGISGPQTIAGVKTFQSAHGLVADGIVGPLTLAKLLGEQKKTP